VPAKEGETGRILLAIDGEPHTEGAVAWALFLGKSLGWSVTAAHVKDPYLKQFSSDIYAQGREEYLAHVDDCLQETAARIERNFVDEAERSGAAYEVKILSGDTKEALTQEARQTGYRLLVLGKKSTAGFGAWRSGKLSQSISAAVDDLPVMVVPRRGAFPRL
jgi:nucleotide-binding universal stress UspA family protein